MEDQQPRKITYQYPKTISRRKFLLNTALFTGGVMTFLGGTGIVFYKAALANKREGKGTPRKSSSLVLLGDKSEFDQLTELREVAFETELEDGWVKQTVKGIVYVMKDQQGELLIMSPICTHLGCTVAFASNAERQSESNVVFQCPCHGGEFDQYGKVIGGPPPRPLNVFKPIVQDGLIYFDYFSPVQRKT